MATQASNPFYVKQGYADFGGGLQDVVKDYTEKKKAEEQKAANIAKMQEAKEVINSGDNQAIADFMLVNPGISEQVNQNLGIRSDMQKQGAISDAKKILLSSDPRQDMVSRVQRIAESGGDATQSIQLLNKTPDEMKSEALTYLSLNDPASADAYRKGKGPDYKGQELDIKRETLRMRSLENQSRRLDSQIARESNDLKREQLMLKNQELKGKIEQNQAKVVQGKADLQQKAKMEMNQSNSVIESIDTFMRNKDYVDAVTGYRGRAPAVSTTGLEAEAYFDNIKNNLTLENLDKMSGVLSETDIKILSTAASALTPGMSKPAMSREMNKITNVLQNKSSDVQKQILNSSDQAQQEPQQPPAGFTLMTDANGNRAYVGPNGEIQEVK